MTNKFRIILAAFACITIMSEPMSAQKAKKEPKTLTADEAKTVKKDAGGMFADGDFKGALIEYSRLIKSDPQNKEYNFRLGFCYLKAYADKTQAAEYLEKGISSKDKTKENYLYLGLAYHYAKRWDEAIEKYGQYRSAGGKAMRGYADPGRLMEMCEHGQELEAEPPLNVTYENLGKMVNSPGDDYNAIISADGKTLVFTSRRKGNTGFMDETTNTFPSDVYSSTFRDSAGWSKAKGAGTAINSDMDEEVVGMTSNADELLLRLDNIEGRDDLAYSLLKGKNWQKYALLSPANNPKVTESSASISNDGRMLFFATEPFDKDKKGGQGGSDIYICRRDDASSSWGTPENLGPDVNTFYEDKFPFIAADNRTLFFASQGHNSVGGFDIFKTVFDDSTETWSEPVNLGFPVNSTDDEGVFAVTGNGRNAFMSMYREGSLGERDIFKLTFADEKVMPFMTVIKGKAVLTGSTKITLKKVELKRKDNQRVVSSFGSESPNTLGDFVLTAPPGEYVISISGNGFKEHSEDLSITENSVEPLQKTFTISR